MHSTLKGGSLAKSRKLFFRGGHFWRANSGGPKQVKYRNTKYRSFGILTEPNNTQTNLIVYENKGILLYLLFYLILFENFFLIVVFSGFFGFKNGYHFKKSSIFFKKNVQTP